MDAPKINMVQLRRLIKYSTYFEAMAQYHTTAKLPINSASIVYQGPYNSKTATKYLKTFIHIFCSYDETFLDLGDELVKSLKDKIPLDFVVDLAMFLDIKILKHQLLYSISNTTNYLDKINILRAIASYQIEINLVNNFFHAFMVSTPLPDNVKDKELDFFLQKSNKQLNKIISRKMKQVNLEANLVTDKCNICDHLSTFPSFKLREYFKISFCCMSLVHEICYKHMIKTFKMCTICGDLADNFKTQNLTKRLELIAKNNDKNYKFYSPTDMSESMIYYQQC
ncbi:hypothetical protein ACF0H5_010709 [Mactra antiquata]